MQTPISFCDITARYGQRSAAPSLAEQTGWNPDQLFLSYLEKVRAQRERSQKEAVEDALMDMVDAMNDPEPTGENRMVQSFSKAGKAISEEMGGKGDPMERQEMQTLLAMIRMEAAFRMADQTEDREEPPEYQERGSEAISDPTT